MQRISLHVPEVLNDGSAVPLELYDPYEDELLNIALEAQAETGIGEVGFSASLNVLGVWRSDLGQKHREPIRLYWLDVGDLRRPLERVRRLAIRIRHELDQAAVYVTVVPVDVVLVTELGEVARAGGDPLQLVPTTNDRRRT